MSNKKTRAIKEFFDLPNRDISLPFEWNGSQYWFDLEGRHHREDDLPAVVSSDGYQEWFKHGLSHRENDQPSVVQSDGTCLYLYEGKYHRVAGPAVVGADGGVKYYLEDRELSHQEWSKEGTRYLASSKGSS